MKYSWLKDDGTGHLTFAGAVNISTPVFSYAPPVGGAPAQVVAAVAPPPPLAPPVYQFGPASWVKEIKTTAHKANRVRLEDLVGDDPGKPQPWANGEPSEVEVEWRVLQTEFAAGNGGKNGELQGAPEGLPGGNEVVTRRYEFYKYVGPVDAETGEAMADTVGPDGKHGVGVVTYADHIDPATGDWVLVTVDLSTVVVVGDYSGAQMAGFDAGKKLGLIAHLQSGDINVPYVNRSLVIGGTGPVATTMTGALPKGMSFNAVTGILSGTPTVAGTFTLTLHSMDAAGGNVTNTYTLTIAGGNAVNTFNVQTAAYPAVGGTTSGGGAYKSGNSVTVQAFANAGYHFVSWTENGKVVSAVPGYTFTASANRALIANFAHNVYNVTGQFAMVAGNYQLNAATGHYLQAVTLTNKGAALAGPLSLVLDYLSANAGLYNKTGVTTLLAPVGSPYLNFVGGNLAAGASVTVTLEFTAPTKAAITYTPRVLAGSGIR